MSDSVALIKERLPVQEVIAPYVKLTRAGKSLRGLCPFHKEKTPSFHVSPERGTWHCFGCGIGGDIFSFIEKIEGVDFKGSLVMLAEKAGVTLEQYQGNRGEQASRKERLRNIMSRASEWYARNFKGSPAAEYAESRGITHETAHAWRLGFAPDGWRTLLEAFTAEGFTTEELLSAGLIKEADGKIGTYYDRFRNRLMFPICDVSGRIVAFTGRALQNDDIAKYLNSPETDLYHKSDVLFGIDRAKDAIRARRFTMLVEGQMDVLLAHQAGFQNAVALSGTALSQTHLSIMKRYSENLMLVLDADTAGLLATAKSAVFALRAGLNVKAARLPKGKDPADLIRENVKDFTARIAAAKPIVEFFLTELAEQETDPHRLLQIAENVVLPLIAAIQSPMEREHFIQITGRSLGLSGEAVRESLTRLPKIISTERDMVNLRAPKTELRGGSNLRLEQLLAIYRAYPDTPLAQRVKSEYCRITEANELPSASPPEHALFTVEQTFGEDPKEGDADELLRAFEEAVIREAYQVAVTQLRRAESQGDPVLIESAQAKCANLSARLVLFGK